jgi:5-methylcytosine-specific restriction endonuclease McrA
MKTCRRCEKRKPEDGFDLAGYRADGSTPKGDGRRVVCKACVSDARRKRMAEWPESRREEVRRRTRAWQKANPYHHKAHQANLQAKRRGADGVLSPADVRAAWERWGGFCWVCGDAATQVDHFRPINRLAGGKNAGANIRPICGDCNHKRSYRWHGEDLAAREAVLLKQLKELLK